MPGIQEIGLVVAGVLVLAAILWVVNKIGSKNKASSS